MSDRTPPASKGLELLNRALEAAYYVGDDDHPSDHEAVEAELRAYLTACESVVEAARHVIEMFPFAGLSFLAPDERDALIALDKELKAVDELGGITQTTGDHE